MRPETTRFEVGIVRDKARIAQARGLREMVLARDNELRPGEERFEEHCDHLVVRDTNSGNVVGAYRILSPVDARKAGGYMADRDFDLALLIVLRERMVEIDRPCVDPLYPYQSVKDVRTGHETGQALAVLEGEIDDFIDAEIRWLRRGEANDKQ